MARHDLRLHQGAYSDTAETHTSIELGIRAGLRRAFPLPGSEQVADAKFNLLLATLARRNDGDGQAGHSFAGQTS
jgi:hypothetical protein